MVYLPAMLIPFSDQRTRVILEIILIKTRNMELSIIGLHYLLWAKHLAANVVTNWAYLNIFHGSELRATKGLHYYYSFNNVSLIL